MKHIYQRGESWYYQFTVRGRRYQGAIGEVSKAVAREVAEKKRVEALEGKLIERPLKAPILGQYDASVGTFTGAAEKFFSFYRENRRATSTRRAFSLLANLCREMGGKRLDEIHPFMLEQYRAKRKAVGLSDASVNRELACLKNLFNMGIKWGWVRENPVREVKLVRENNARLRWLTKRRSAG